MIEAWLFSFERVCNVSNVLEIAGEVSQFGFRAILDAFRRPFEGAQIQRQIVEVGSKSLPLLIASGFSLGAVLTLHTRSTLVTFGASSIILGSRNRESPRVPASAPSALASTSARSASALEQNHLSP